MNDIYNAIKSGKTNTELINEFCTQLNEARAQYNKEQAARKQQEEDKKRQDKLASARYYVIDDFADYLELLFPEYTTDRAETENMIERTLLEFEDSFASLDKTLKTISDILTSITKPSKEQPKTPSKENAMSDDEIIRNFIKDVLKF